MNLNERTVYNSANDFILRFKRDIKGEGGITFWVLNKQNGEIYHFIGTQVSEFDVAIDLYNTLEQEHIFTSTFVIHMNEKIVEFFKSIPGKIYLKKIECFRELYQSLSDKLSKGIKDNILRVETEDKIEFIELTFPEFLI